MKRIKNYSLICYLMFGFFVFNHVDCHSQVKNTDTLSQESYYVAIYEKTPYEVEVIYHSLLDSLEKNWGCTGPAYLILSVDSVFNRIELGKTDLHALKALNIKENLTCFKLENTYILFFNFDLIKAFWNRSFTQTELVELDTFYKNNHSKECDYFIYEENKFPLWYSLTFNFDDGVLTFDGYREFVEFGDHLYYMSKQKRRKLESDSVFMRVYQRYAPAP